MARTLITLAFVGIVGLANAQDAQDRQINVTETPAMAAVVEKRVALVDKTVDLSAEQREKVTEVYKRVETQFAAINARYDMAEGMTAADKEADMKLHYQHWDTWTNDQLSHILSEAQMAKWAAANK